MNNRYDIIVVGCGPAGMTSAIYAARANKKVLIMDKEGVGGQIAKSPKVENFPGFSEISGSDLAFKMFDQITGMGVDFEIEEALSIERNNDDGDILVTTINSIYRAGAVIIASGASPVSLEVPGGKEYVGNGVYYCVMCDGPLFVDKDVLVVGGGNSGAQYAIELSNYCATVTMCDVTDHLCCEPMLAQKIINNTKITTLLPAIVKSVNKVENKMIVNFTNDQTVVVDGIFVAIGQEPSTGFVEDTLTLNNNGYIITENNVYTSTAGIFVAGDCRVKTIRQAVAASSDGAEAATAAIKYLNNK